MNSKKYEYRIKKTLISKTGFLIFLSILPFCGFSQENFGKDSLKTVVFSFTPRTKKVQQVNGLAIGLGYDMENNKIQKVNGINLELSPFGILYFLFDDPSRRGFGGEPTVKVNGLTISAGHSNQDEEIAYSGLSLSLLNTGYSCNGISVNGLYNYSTKLNGLHISGIANISQSTKGLSISLSNTTENLRGMQVGAFNDADDLKGMQLGIFNKSSKCTGIQIGIVNKSKAQKGLQLGFWNINDKRSFPFLNW